MKFMQAGVGTWFGLWGCIRRWRPKMWLVAIYLACLGGLDSKAWLVLLPLRCPVATGGRCVGLFYGERRLIPNR